MTTMLGSKGKKGSPNRPEDSVEGVFRVVDGWSLTYDGSAEFV